MVVVAAAACPGCRIRVERVVPTDCLPFRAICRACGAHVILIHPRDANGTNGGPRLCLDCGEPLTEMRAARNFRGATPGVRLWICPDCRLHHSFGEPGSDISRFLYLWNRRMSPHGQLDP